jgi:hypothetical protein
MPARVRSDGPKAPSVETRKFRRLDTGLDQLGPLKQIKLSPGKVFQLGSLPPQPRRVTTGPPHPIPEVLPTPPLKWVCVNKEMQKTLMPVGYQPDGRAVFLTGFVVMNRETSANVNAGELVTA